jgi:Flp pilus assembly pilin Flp
MKQFLLRLRQDESGAALVEYTVLLGLLLALTAATMTTVGSNVSTVWTNVQSFMGTAASSGG